MRLPHKGGRLPVLVDGRWGPGQRTAALICGEDCVLVPVAKQVPLSGLGLRLESARLWIGVETQEVTPGRVQNFCSRALKRFVVPRVGSCWCSADIVGLRFGLARNLRNVLTLSLLRLSSVGQVQSERIGRRAGQGWVASYSSGSGRRQLSLQADSLRSASSGFR